MLAVPELGLQGLYIGKTPLISAPTHHTTCPGNEIQPQSTHGCLSQKGFLSACVCTEGGLLHIGLCMCYVCTCACRTQLFMGPPARLLVCMCRAGLCAQDPV